MPNPLSHFQHSYEEYLNGDLSELVSWSRPIDKRRLERVFLEVVRKIDTRRLEAERERLLDEQRRRLGDRFETDLGSPFRFLYHEYWLLAAVIKALNLGLDEPSQQKIVDLGTGCGYFISVCNALGHEAWGLDAPDAYLAVIKSGYTEVFQIARRVQGIDELVLRAAILPKTRLGVLDPLGTLDLITAFRSNFFSGRLQKRPDWTRSDWRFLLTDLTARLSERGRVVLELNRNVDLSEFQAVHAEFRDRVQHV